MVLTVENGSVVANADSYLSVADADTYWTDRGNPSDWSGAATADKEASLRYATQYIDANINWLSELADPSNQVLEWPRVVFIGRDGRTYGGNEAGDIPQSLKDAVAELALQYIKEDFTQPSQEGSLVRRERVGQSEVEYNRRTRTKTFTYAFQLVRHIGSPGASNVELFRA